ncbi:hypothetical protein L6R52_39225, partial [Myxococcota bacterium]|nr:hypothetical protein [Myxococcota bacterium]
RGTLPLPAAAPVAKIEPAPAATVGPAAPARRSPPAEGVDVVRMAKAQKLFDQALKDKADGNVVSARMNMKLALTFDPTNELYQQAFDELSKGGAGAGGGGVAPGGGPAPSPRSRAREHYDQATRAEETGNVDEAIALLEKALAESKEAAFLNRLGVILAMKKKEFARAQALIENAIELAPGNATYQHNLRKVLSMAAAHDVDARNSSGKKAGLLGFLGRKK